ncbi:hypothetical protein HELRODRAFT_82522 [Helobdella robusta]|uniref:Uncharacterized protein n=1 Tax=Helobdella robusta TaxID=6412 RepID=T1G4T2_HELRO|nr:hypothetical protein HELRODRAFT_82522 [Helobdella robusta]ESO00907.1 hypothetical protein HELRODRAFT_82522 [Helobdella robusta]
MDQPTNQLTIQPINQPNNQPINQPINQPTNQPTQQDASDWQSLWYTYESRTSHLAQDLCEQLRLILEPTQAAKLKGDYRTGKRISMRKVIQYIASQFRKDKIWLRRSKLSKRRYTVMVAVDDSSSITFNDSKEVGRGIMILEMLLMMMVMVVMMVVVMMMKTAVVSCRKEVREN